MRRSPLIHTVMILESSDFDPREENAYSGGELKVTKAVARGHNVLVSLLKSITFFINVIIITPLDVQQTEVYLIHFIL